MLSINTYTTYSCSKKKESSFVTVLSVCLVTAVFTLLLLPIVPRLTNFGSRNGNGLFFISGFLYVIPLKYLLNQPIKHMMIIMSSSWIYTMFVFSFSVRVGYLFPLEFLSLAILIVQTLVYAMTFPHFKKFVNKIFIYILRNIENQMINSLLVISLSWFFLIFLLNYTFVEGNSFISEIIILFVIIGNAILSYKLVYNLVSVNNKAKTLSQITKIDTLTQLKNREGLYEDALQKIENNTTFTIIFVDLDVFKSVNDCFGHAAGDAYLIEFVKTVKEVLKISEGFYRLHGDEFVFLVDKLEVEAFCSKIEKLEFLNDPDGVAFKGLSLGYSSFPVDGNTLSDLLYLADLRMYQVKKDKHRV